MRARSNIFARFAPAILGVGSFYNYKFTATATTRCADNNEEPAKKKAPLVGTNGMKPITSYWDMTVDQGDRQSDFLTKNRFHHTQQKKDKEEKDRKKEERILSDAAELRARNAAATAAAIKKKNEIDPVRAAIDNVDVIIRDQDDEYKEKRIQKGKPKNWRDIARHAMTYTIAIAINSYETTLNRSYRASEQAIGKWIKQLKADPNISSERRVRQPIVGHDVDALLYREVIAMRKKGLPVDDMAVRLMLKRLLQVHGK